MILEGPTITDYYKEMTSAALSIDQLLKFNSIKYGRKEPTTEAVSVAQETPVPTYVRLMLHGYTQKKELVDRLYQSS